MNTGRTKADSGADIFGFENSSAWNEQRVQNEHKSNVPIYKLIATAIGADQSPIQLSDEKRGKPTNTIAESFYMIEQNPEFTSD